MVPLRPLQRRVIGNQWVATLLLSMKDGSNTNVIKSGLTQLLRERRKLAQGDDDNFNALDTKQLVKTLSDTIKVMTTLLVAMAAVSLLAGGIGLMNSDSSVLPTHPRNCLTACYWRSETRGVATVFIEAAY